MSWQLWVSRNVKAGTAVACLLGGLSMHGQVFAQQAGRNESSALSDSLKGLEEQVGGLKSAIQELRAEVVRSRRENLELRQELRDTQERLTALVTKLGERGSVTVASRTTSDSPSSGAGPTEQLTGKDTDERLQRIEENQQLLSGKVDEQYQTKVESASKYRVRLSGIAILNIFGNRGSVDNQDLPSFVRERGPLDSAGNFGASVRQSLLGLEVFGPKLGNARTSGDVQFDFFGGFPNTPDGVTAGLVRLRTARVHFDWVRTSIVAGQDIPFFSPLSPTSLASLALPAFSYSGNLWTWTPQVRIEHRIQISEASSLMIQGGILDPLTGEPAYAQFYRSPQAGERSGQPAYAVRTAWSRNSRAGPVTLGVGGYYARQNWGFQRRVDAWGGTADWSIPFSRWLILSGEFYRGRALGGLGAGAGRSVLYSGPLTDPATAVLGLNTAGGWSQVKFRPTEKVEFNSAFGEDVPFSRDLDHFPTSLSYLDVSLGRNQSGFFNVIYHARSNLLFSAEYRRLWTFRTYEPKETADHLNLSVGVLF